MAVRTVDHVATRWERYLRWAAWVNSRKPGRRETERLHAEIDDYLAGLQRARKR